MTPLANIAIILFVITVSLLIYIISLHKDIKGLLSFSAQLANTVKNQPHNVLVLTCQNIEIEFIHIPDKKSYFHGSVTTWTDHQYSAVAIVEPDDTIEEKRDALILNLAKQITSNNAE